MTDTHTISAIANKLRTATTFADVFGSVAGGTTEERVRALRKSFAYLVRMVHPDHAPPALAKEAGEVFLLLTNARTTAEKALVSGRYDTEAVALSSSATDIEFISSRATYRCAESSLYSGDFSHIYRGVIQGSGKAVLVKIARDPTRNAWLEREALVHARLMALPKVGQFVPQAEDSFLAAGDAGTLYRVNVTGATAGQVSVATILKAYPHGLPPEDAAWIARRVFAQAVLAGMAGVVHGAIIPEHVLVNPINREPLHIGWIHSVDVGASARITHIIDRYRAWYPREVLDRQPVGTHTDIAMAARVTTALFTGTSNNWKFPKTIPDSLVRLLTKCTEESASRRTRDANAVLEEFTKIIRATWGRTYRPLVLTV